jgi:hypothetical protein
MRAGRLFAGRLLAVAASASACSSAGTGALAPPTPDERTSLQTLRALVRGPSASSDIFADGDAHAVAIAVMRQLSSPAIPEVDIYRWERSGWHSAASITLDVGGSVAADEGSTTPIRTADITPAATPELVVTVHYNAGPAAAIVSEYGGHWHTLGFHGGLTQDGDERFAVAVRPDGTVTSRENDCVPNCADGHEVTTSYRFSTVTGRLEGR